MSKYKAVVFDLWGTLVDELTYPEANRLVYQQKTDETADLLGMDRDGFARAWAATLADRKVGAFPSTEAAMSHICRELGAEPGEDRIHAVAEMRCEYVREALSPRPGTVETLSTLRDSGYRVGLISNCGRRSLGCGVRRLSRRWWTPQCSPSTPALQSLTLASTSLRLGGSGSPPNTVSTSGTAAAANSAARRRRE